MNQSINKSEKHPSTQAPLALDIKMLNFSKQWSDVTKKTSKTSNLRLPILLVINFLSTS